MNSSSLSFSALTAQDLREWKALPVSKSLERYLDEERQIALEAIAEAVAEGKDREAAVLTGGLRVLALLFGRLNPPERPPAEPEEKYVDPAAIRKPQVNP